MLVLPTTLRMPLGDVVYVDLPSVGDSVAAEDSFGEIESTKSVSDLFAPIAGEIVAVNEGLEDDPALVNSDPYGEGWIIEIRPRERLMIWLTCWMQRRTRLSWLSSKSIV